MSELEASKTVLDLVQKVQGVLAGLNFYRNEAHEIKANILSVRDEIKPRDTVTSPFDLTRHVETPDFSNLTVEASFDEWSKEELRALVAGVKLEGNEVDLVELLKNVNVQAELKRRSTPVCREAYPGAHRDLQRASQVTVPVREGDAFEVDAKGTIRNAREQVGLHKEYTAIAVDANGPVIATEKMFGLRGTECEYVRGVIREAIAVALRDPALLERHFRLRGDMEALVPVYAAQLAAEDQALHAGKGEIEQVPVKGRDGMKLARFVSPRELVARITRTTFTG